MLLEHYQNNLKQRGFSEDPAQREVIAVLQSITDQLAQKQKAGLSTWLTKKPASIRGLYLWGGVGRGKTWLVDLFYEHLNEPKKQRLHFHRFMQQVHAELGNVTGKKNPLKLVAKKMASQWRVLCLDEFNVVDITDAIIFARLLQSLFEEGIVLLTTSNIEPENLYRDGIQRASFLPAIRLIQQNTEIIQMGGERDYRQALLTQQRVYHWPHNNENESLLSDEFSKMACSNIDFDGDLIVNNRSMPYRQQAEGIVWFDFEALCGPPRSQYDYIELARCQQVVFISNVPAMGASKDDRSRRFIFLVDEFYDRRVKLILSAEVPLERLYMGERLAFEFQRTVSRLREMQTPSYLGKSHRG